MFSLWEQSLFWHRPRSRMGIKSSFTFSLCIAGPRPDFPFRGTRAPESSSKGQSVFREPNLWQDLKAHTVQGDAGCEGVSAHCSCRKAVLWENKRVLKPLLSVVWSFFFVSTKFPFPLTSGRSAPRWGVNSASSSIQLNTTCVQRHISVAGMFLFSWASDCQVKFYKEHPKENWFILPGIYSLNLLVWIPPVSHHLFPLAVFPSQ